MFKKLLTKLRRSKVLLSIPVLVAGLAYASIQFTTPVYAVETQTFTIRYSGDKIQGESVWNQGHWTHDTSDLFWLEKVKTDTNGDVTYRIYTGLRCHGYGKTHDAWTKAICQINVNGKAFSISPSGKWWDKDIDGNGCWKNGGGDTFKTTLKAGKTYTVSVYVKNPDGQTASQWTGSISIPNVQYSQTIQARYQNADGTWGNYSTVKSGNANYNSTYSWSRAADTTYKAASVSYTVTGNTTKYVDVYRQVYTDTIQHWMWGFTNNEGNNGSKNAYLIQNTTFTKRTGQGYTLNANDAVTVPNGYYLASTFGTSDINGSWNKYDLGYSGTQAGKNMGFEYDYQPYTYTITYNLDGGTNNSANPSTYNVLYGVSLKNPTKEGYTFDGWYNGNTKVTGINEGANATFTDASDMYSKLKSRTTGNITLTAKWTINTYTNTIQHWAGGFKNQEGNNGDKSWFSLGTTNYTKQYQGSYTLNSNDSITPPNGYYLQTNFGTANINGQWGSYDMPYTGNQIAQNMYFEYYYSPYTYTISYNLDGGTNDTSNPSSYNVLYGVTLKNPTKKGYRFLGWYDGDTKVTGINEGATATFSSKDDMYNKLKTRITGNKTLTAKWQNITYYIDYDLNITGLTDQFADTLKDNNGSEAGRETALFDEATTLQSPQSLTKYVFKGWNTKADGTGKMYTGSINQDGSVCEAGKTLKLYAIWDTTPDIGANDFYLIEGVEAPSDVARTGVGFDKTPTSKYPDQMKKVAYPIKGTTKNGTDISDKIKIDYIEYNGSKVSTIDTNKTGTYTIHYSLTDGKNTKKFTRKTTVLPFSTPSINAGDKYYKRGSDITIDKLKENITANDKYDGDLVTEVEVDDMDKINNNVVGSYDIIYKVKNSSNKTTTKTVKVNIIDYLPDNEAENGNSFRYIEKDCTEVNDYCMQYFDETSKWKTDEALTEQIMDSLSKDSSSQAVKKYSFSSKEVEKGQKKQ